MCAKKATPANKPAAKGSPKTRSVAKNGMAAAKATAKSPASAKPSAAVATAVERKLSNEDIGTVAGEIWGLLTAKNGQSLASIKKAVAAPNDVIVAAIGWLAREAKLEFTMRGRTQRISLKR